MLALGNYYESINSMENAVKYYDDASAEEDGYGLYKLGDFTSNGVLDKVYKTKHDVSVAYGLFKKAIHFLQQINVKNVHLVYGNGIRTHDLSYMSHR